MRAALFLLKKLYLIHLVHQPYIYYFPVKRSIQHFSDYLPCIINNHTQGFIKPQGMVPGTIACYTSLNWVDLQLHEVLMRVSIWHRTLYGMCILLLVLHLLITCTCTFLSVTGRLCFNIKTVVFVILYMMTTTWYL